MSAYHDTIDILLHGGDLGVERASAVMRDIFDGICTPVQIAGVLSALAQRVETAEELTGFAKVMRERAIPVKTAGDPIDTCGTGGSGLQTANTSTTVAFVLAAGGVQVAKHGNRASSGICGGMDVLEHLGVTIDLGPDAAAAVLADCGLVFLFAPNYHPALRAVGPIRRELGFRTIFNFLGPLCNPANVSRQVLGVSDSRRAPNMAKALSQLGSKRVIVAYGNDGLDELSITGPTHILEIRDGQMHETSIEPGDVGLASATPSEIQGGDRDRNAELLVQVLKGTDKGAHARHVAMNAGAGFYVADRAASLKDGVALATQILDSGAGYDMFERYRKATSRFQGAVK